jgi:hypothetical protein
MIKTGRKPKEIRKVKRHDADDEHESILARWIIHMLQASKLDNLFQSTKDLLILHLGEGWWDVEVAQLKQAAQGIHDQDREEAKRDQKVKNA